MSNRDELARDIFIAHNWNELPVNALKDWTALTAVQGEGTYAHRIADGLIAAGYRKATTA